MDESILLSSMSLTAILGVMKLVHDGLNTLADNYARKSESARKNQNRS